MAVNTYDFHIQYSDLNKNNTLSTRRLAASYAGNSTVLLLWNLVMG